LGFCSLTFNAPQQKAKTKTKNEKVHYKDYRTGAVSIVCINKLFGSVPPAPRASR